MSLEASVVVSAAPEIWTSHLLHALVNSIVLFALSYVIHWVCSHVFQFSWASDVLDLRYLAGLFFCYDLVRRLSVVNPDIAIMHATNLYEVELVLSVNFEWTLQQIALAYPTLLSFLNTFYVSTSALCVLPLFLYLKLRTRLPWGWLLPDKNATNNYWKYCGIFALMNGTALLFFFFFPCAPPRLVPGLHIRDTVKDGIGLDPYQEINSQLNPFAAFPSMHFGYAAFISLALYDILRPHLRAYSFRAWRVITTILLLYPIVMALSIMATGNHFFLDAVGGAGCLLLAVCAQSKISEVRQVDANVLPL